jgi:hypothetical protein
MAAVKAKEKEMKEEKEAERQVCDVRSWNAHLSKCDYDYMYFRY